MAQQAINAKYTSLGGATGVLGAAKSPLITDPATGLSHIDYTNGGIYFTFADGAHAIYGDIYTKWIAAGGTKSNIGYPITDVTTTTDIVGKTCHYSNFKIGGVASGAIYSTADDGPHLIYGNIWLKWIAAGDVKSNVGYPITDEAGAVDANGKEVRFNNFKYGGAIYWTGDDGANLIYGNIWLKWLAAGGVKSNIGYPITDEVGAVDIAGESIRFNNFKYGGAIYWTNSDGAHLIYGNIWQKWVAAGGVTSNIGYPITDEAWAPDNVCRFNNFKYGGAIYWTPQDGAHLIYGNIWLKWLSLGGVNSNIGYPITDEASTPANDARFNSFKNGGAIYWDRQHGASVIYGEIYKRFLALGGPGSFLSHPITDETSSGNHGGRYNDFTGGSIYWNPSFGAREHQGPLPESVEVNRDYTFPDGVAAGGSTNVTLHQNGDVHFKVHFHDSGLVDYKYSVACALRDFDGQVYTLGHASSIGGTFGGSRNDDFDETKNRGEIATGWRAIIAANPVGHQENARVDVDLGALVDEIVALVQKIGPIVGTVISLFG